MRSRLLLLVILSSLLLVSLSTVSAQSDESETYGGETTETVDAPILGWYLIPVLGAMRRQRHELNDRSYESSASNEEDQIPYISK